MSCRGLLLFISALHDPDCHKQGLEGGKLCYLNLLGPPCSGVHNQRTSPSRLPLARHSTSAPRCSRPTPNGFIWRLDVASLLRLINAAISMGAPRITMDLAMDPVVPTAAMEGEVLGLRADDPRSGYLSSLSPIRHSLLHGICEERVEFYHVRSTSVSAILREQIWESAIKTRRTTSRLAKRFIFSSTNSHMLSHTAFIAFKRRGGSVL
jgi:hypothetical protein